MTFDDDKREKFTLRLEHKELKKIIEIHKNTHKLLSKCLGARIC